jgi:hypothetical protein
MTDLVVKMISPEGYHEWNTFVQASPQGTIFHTSDWILACKRHLHLGMAIFGCYEDGKLVGGCPLFTGKYRGLFPTAFSDSPMNPYGGFILPPFPPHKTRDRENHEMRVFSALCGALSKEGYVQIRIINSPGFLDVRYFIRNSWTEKIRYTYYIDLDNVVFSRLARRQIQKAQENNISVEFTRDVGVFSDLLAMTFAKQDLEVPISRGALSAIAEVMFQRERAEIMVARTPSGDPVAADFFIYDDNCVYRWASASNPSLRQNGGHYRLIADAFQHFREKGFRIMDGMTGNVRHLGEFTANFSPRLVPYYILQKKHPVMQVIGLGMK